MEQFGKNNEEKRKHKRVSATFIVLYAVMSPFPVRIRIGDRDYSAIAQDIGEGGMALLLNFEIPVNSLLSLKFNVINDAILSNEDRMYNFELDAQVRYCELVQTKTYRIGVSFMNILPSGSAFIANYIRINTLTRNPNA